jgi:hypothetical protein
MKDYLTLHLDIDLSNGIALVLPFYISVTVE